MELESVSTVVRWSEKRGLGEIESPDTPGGCWVHFSHVLVQGDGFRALRMGEVVPFGYEAADQDGYPYRARWVGSSEPGGPRGPSGAESGAETTASAAYSSTLTITDDDQDETPAS